jgi:hypothetical protein
MPLPLPLLPLPPPQLVPAAAAAAKLLIFVRLSAHSMPLLPHLAPTSQWPPLQLSQGASLWG